MGSDFKNRLRDAVPTGELFEGPLEDRVDCVDCTELFYAAELNEDGLCHACWYYQQEEAEWDDPSLDERQEYTFQRDAAL